MLWNNVCIKCILKYVMEIIFINLIFRYIVGGLSLLIFDIVELRYFSFSFGIVRFVEGLVFGNI